MTKKRRKKIFIITLSSIIAIFLLLNIAIIVQAYSLSHFDKDAKPLTPDYKPTFIESVKIAICGIDVPRPHTKQYPSQTYDSLYIPIDDNKQLDAWLLHTDSLKKGLVIAFHGYMDEKSSMLDRANVLLSLGYDVLLVNFMGAGDSYGDQTTMGYLEAENVKAVHEYAITQLQEDNITLIGFSMGAVAIMKAQHDYNLVVKRIILETPYGTFKGTVDARLDQIHIPHYPASNLFTFWFGKINGFNAFEANPQEYGKKINTPTLLMCGGKDPHISKEETQHIFDLLGSKNKEMMIFTESAHESYLLKYHKEWGNIVSHFISKTDEMDVYNE